MPIIFIHTLPSLMPRIWNKSFHMNRIKFVDCITLLNCMATFMGGYLYIKYQSKMYCMS